MVKWWEWRWAGKNDMKWLQRIRIRICERVRKLIPRTTTTNTIILLLLAFFDQLETTQLRLGPQNSSKEELMRIANVRLFTGQMPFMLPNQCVRAQKELLPITDCSFQYASPSLWCCVLYRAIRDFHWERCKWSSNNNDRWELSTTRKEYR